LLKRKRRGRTFCFKTKERKGTEKKLTQSIRDAGHVFKSMCIGRGLFQISMQFFLKLALAGTHTAIFLPAGRAGEWVKGAQMGRCESLGVVQSRFLCLSPGDVPFAVLTAQLQDKFQ
jgi:hypothetical protein